MEHIEYERMYQAEDRHWWYKGMEAITRSILDYYLPSRRGLNILDAGCGTGAAMATYLNDFGKVTGFDISPLALRSCKARNLSSLALASITEGPYKADTFDLVTSFDVLCGETVLEDGRAFEDFHRILHPGGFVLLRLPAYNWLRGQHDVTVHTVRRYSFKQTSQLLQANGFKVIHITYVNMMLFPLALAKRLLERIWPPDANASDLEFPVGGLNTIFRMILSSEAPLATRQALPFGLSVVALGQKL